MRAKTLPARRLNAITQFCEEAANPDSEHSGLCDHLRLHSRQWRRPVPCKPVRAAYRGNPLQRSPPTKSAPQTVDLLADKSLTRLQGPALEKRGTLSAKLVGFHPTRS